MIEFREVSIKKENFELKDISLEIKPNECFAILGPSGAGKSTLIKALLGLQKPHSGKIFYKNKDITNLEVQKRGFAYVPQNLALFPHLKVEENLLFNKKLKDNYFKELIEVANIKHLLKRYPNTLSGGERQRVALVRALLTKSKVLILDEPFSALDISLKKELWFFVDKLKKRFGITLILITHNLDEAYFLSDSIAIIKDGKIIQQDSKDNIFNNPKCLEVARYLGMKNIFAIEPLDKHKFKIKSSNLIYTSQNELKSNISYIIIKESDIKFTTPNSPNAIKGEYEILEFIDYNIVIFTTPLIDRALEIKIDKNEKVTNYISLNSKKFIYVTSCN